MTVRLKYLIIHVKYLKYQDIAHHQQFKLVASDPILRSSPVYIAHIVVSTSTPLSFDHHHLSVINSTVEFQLSSWECECPTTTVSFRARIASL